MKKEKFEDLKNRYVEVKEEAKKQEKYSINYKIGYLKAELEYNKEGLSQKQILELMQILFN